MTNADGLTVRELGIQEWASLDLDSPYYTKSYCDASGSIEPDFVSSVCLEFFECHTDAVAHLPLLLRRIPGTRYLDATSPYGYGGFRGDPISSESLQTAMAQWASERNVIAAFLRSDPTEVYQYRTAEPMPDQIRVGSTVLWPTEDRDKLMSGMKKKHRQYTRKAQREGLTARVVREVDELRSFATLYGESMERLNAGEYYRFGNSYWDALVAADGLDLVLVEVAQDNQTVCGLLCLAGGSTLHAHLLGTSDLGRSLKANYLAYFTAAEWSAVNGMSYLHVGGGFGGAESDLLEWKTGFCPSEPLSEFSVTKLVLDRTAYSEVAGTDGTEGHFPPWRS